MNDKLGRNDPCPCGSGKKYKKCCITTSAASLGIVDFEYCKLRKLEGTVFDRHLLPYVDRELPDAVIVAALADCLSEEGLPDAMDKELLVDRLVLPWALFNWIPCDDFDIDQFDSEITISQNYLKIYGEKLSSDEKRFIEAMNHTYYSFYSVIEVEIDKSFLVKDIMLGTTHTIKEQQGTHQAKRGDVVFSRILTLDDQSIFVGMAPFIVPADYNNTLIDFREWLIGENNNNKLTPGVMRNEFDFDLFEYFFEIMTKVCNPPLPTLVNTDDEPFQCSKAYFKLMITPEEALNRLLPLTLEDDPSGFLTNAKRDKSGVIKQLEFSWLKKGNKHHKEWDNTVMGHITAEAGRLILETNSENRAQIGRELLSEYLGEDICFQQTLIESTEQKFKALSESPHKNNQENLIPPDSPGIQEQLKEMAKAHWENWFDRPIPALNDQTPREATTTANGRERLEALLLQYERRDLEKGDNDLFKADIKYLKEQLALD